MIFGRSIYWRETMKPAKFLIFDGRVVLVLVPALMHLRFWTLITAMLTMMIFWYFERKGIPADSILRFLRSKIVGKKRTARGVFEERTAIDFGFESTGYLARAKSEALLAEANEAGAPKKGIFGNLMGNMKSVTPAKKVKPENMPEDKVKSAKLVLEKTSLEEDVSND